MTTAMVGIDFGTSLTKVTYRVFGQSPEVRPVLFTEPGGGKAWYIPSLVAMDGNRIRFGHEAAQCIQKTEWNEAWRHLKVLLAGEVSEKFRNETLDQAATRYTKSAIELGQTPTRALCAAFLAEVMRITRTYIVKEVGDDLKLLFNVCMPIAQIEDAPVLQEFETVLALAQRLYENSYVADLQLLIENPRPNYAEDAKETCVFFAEELHAQLTSYIDSAAMTNGVHAVIDFGAGTTDMTLLWLSTDQEGVRGRYGLSCRNIPLGLGAVDVLAAELLDHVGHARTQDNIHDAIRLADNRDADWDDLWQRLKDTTSGLYKESRVLWQEAYGILLDKKKVGQQYWDPSLNTENPPIIYTLGGGGGSRTIREKFSRSWMADMNWAPYTVGHLPLPDSSKWTSKSEAIAPFSRMAVAYGLTSESHCKELPSAPIARVIPNEKGPDDHSYNPTTWLGPH